MVIHRRELPCLPGAGPAATADTKTSMVKVVVKLMADSKLVVKLIANSK